MRPLPKKPYNLGVFNRKDSKRHNRHTNEKPLTMSTTNLKLLADNCAIVTVLPTLALLEHLAPPPNWAHSGRS